MRKLLFILAWGASVALAADGPDALETTRQFVSSGAPQLALMRIEQLQPRDAAVPLWGEWEKLRLNLLFRFKRHEEVLDRVAALPGNFSLPAQREALKLAVRSAVASGKGAQARHYAARLLWQTGAAADDLGEIRLLVIDSLVADRQGDDAFRSMLRFQQDYQPLERTVAARFVDALLELGMAREAVNWLGSLDEADPLKLLLRLATGLVPADAATAQARARLAKNHDAGYWRVLAQAAVQQKNRALQIEALENTLQLAAAEHAQRRTAQQLWQVYFAVAQEFASQNQLPTANDSGWLDRAARLRTTQPFVSRSLLADLAVRGQMRETRHHAQLQLIAFLRSDKRERVALRLFRHADLEIDALDSEGRYLLGGIAESHDLPAEALRYWQGLNAPRDVGAAAWQLRIAAIAVRAAMPEHAATAIRNAIAAAKTLPAELAQRSVTLVQGILDAGRIELARELFEALLPQLNTAQQRIVLFALGRIHENAGRLAAAADHHLRSALLADGRDALALQARLAAALDLARAGYKEDARAQFEWLLRNSKDAAQLEIARRELKKL
ncbi:MAG: hypothetical protein ACK4N4_04805 [Burkholderiales bacterium]